MTPRRMTDSDQLGNFLDGPRPCCDLFNCCGNERTLLADLEEGLRTNLTDNLWHSLCNRLETNLLGSLQVAHER